MNRRQAAESGLPRYNTGKPCARGHSGDRYTTTGNCVACANQSRKVFSAAALARANGKVKLSFEVDVRDEKTVRDFVAAILAAREFDSTVNPTPSMFEAAMKERAS
jgi:hypothetical protein